MAETKRDAFVSEVEHTGTSTMGNPTYRITFSDGTSALTETNGQIGYAATNYRPTYDRALGDVVPRPVTVTFTSKGRIRDITDRTA